MSESETKHPKPETDETRWSEAPFLMVKGFLMGSADIVPGVSGGTMALIVGIYTRLINAITSFNSRFIKKLVLFRFGEAFAEVHWKFVLLLLCGILSAILFFTKVVPLQIYMFTDPELIYGLFFGLIVGSIYILIKEMEAFNWRHLLMVAFGTALGFWVVTLVPTDTPESSLFVFFSGSVAICAMILPGISGSYILLILRKYEYILSQVGALGDENTISALGILIVFALGGGFGLIVFSRLLSWLLNRYYALTLAVLVGFLIGSLYVIWPYQDRGYQQIVIQTETVDYHDPRAVALRENPPDTQRPEFQRLGSVVNPGAAFDALKKIEIETVRQRLIKTDPYIPYVTRSGDKIPHFWSGLVGMGIGLLLVAGLDYLRAR